MAAHAAGLVHRDFKPENVLLDKEGRPRVVDFGLARDANVVEHGIRRRRRHGGDDGRDAEHVRRAGHLDTLTRTGALMGTPAYMAPEQILAEATSERTDQFSFCVALYEALYGERPFTGESLLRLLHNVTRGNLAPVPEDREVPAWIRRALVRGLRSEPRERWPSMAALIGRARGRSRRRATGGGSCRASALAVVLATLLVGAQTIRHRRQELERQVGAHLQAAAQASADGRTPGRRPARAAPARVRRVRRSRPRPGRGAVAAGARGGRRGRRRVRRAPSRPTRRRWCWIRTAPTCAASWPTWSSRISCSPTSCGATTACARSTPGWTATTTGRAGAACRRPGAVSVRRQPAGGGAHARALPARSDDRTSHARAGGAAAIRGRAHLAAARFVPPAGERARLRGRRLPVRGRAR